MTTNTVSRSRRSALFTGALSLAAAPALLSATVRSALAAEPDVDGILTLPKYVGDTSLSRVLKKGELVICTSNDWPYSFLDGKTGAFSGIDAEIIQAVAKMLKIPKVTVQTVPFDGLVPGILSGRFDMVGDSIHFTPARAKVVDFSFPTYFYAETMVVHKGSGIKAVDIKDLKGKSCGSILGTNYTDWIQQSPGVEYRGYKDAQSVAQDVANGRLDAGVYDLPVMAALIKQNPQWPIEINTSYVTRSTHVPANYSRYIFRQEDQQLNLAFSRAIQWMQYNGDMAKILKKWGMDESAW